MTSLAAETRAAVDAHPFIRDGLRAGVVNFAAAARFLDVSGGEEAVATALRRYAEELPAVESRDADVRVTMQSGIGTGDGDLLRIGSSGFAEGAGSYTAIQAVGDVDARLFGTVVQRLAGDDVAVLGAGYADDVLVLVLERRDAAAALTVVEDAAAGYR